LLPVLFNTTLFYRKTFSEMTSETINSTPIVNVPFYSGGAGQVFGFVASQKLLKILAS